MKLPETHFYDAMVELQKKYDIDHDGSTIKHRSKRLDTIEAILHELVHGVCLGNPYWAAEIEGRLPMDGSADAQGRTRDDHELTTLRVELRVYDLLGHPMSAHKRRQLLKHAKFDGELPSFERLQSPLSVAEEALASLTSNLIKKAATVTLEIM